MKTLIKTNRITLLLLFLVTTVAGNAQNTWTFPMIFHDATGVSDTIWFIQNNNATIDIDEQFGEGQCEIDTSRFCVYFMIGNIPSKVIAVPYNYDFVAKMVFATKWEFPITISWDKTLFNDTMGGYAPIQTALLLNSYSDGHDLLGNIIFDNAGWFILGADSTGPQPPFDENDETAWEEFFMMGYATSFFPMSVTLSRNPVGIEETELVDTQIKVSPNPAMDQITISFLTINPGYVEMNLYDTMGKKLKVSYREWLSWGEHQVQMSLSGVSNGDYLLEFVKDHKSIKYLHFIKQ